MFYSQFVAHLVANKSNMPRAVWLAIRDRGAARVIERARAGRGDSPLLFNDLVEEIERAVMPQMGV